MAKTAKKDSTLTLEEKLEQALVPNTEYPYKVPDNWCWGYLTSSFAECKDSFRKPINADERSGRAGSIPYYGATGQVGWIDDYLTDEELVLLGEDGAPFLDKAKNKAYIISGKAWVNNHAHILKSRFGHVGNVYLLHYLNIFDFTGYVSGTTRLKLTQSSMDTIPVPIAPFSEQQRIVDRIESLFAKLDEAKEKAQAVIDGYENRKAAILHKAFTGELTEGWRKKHKFSSEEFFYSIQQHLSAIKKKKQKKVQNSLKDRLKKKIPKEWLLVDLDSISKQITDGEHNTPKRVESYCGYYLLSARNIHDDALRLDNVDYIDGVEYSIISKRCNPIRGDILLSCSGSVGRCCVVCDDNNYCMVRSAAMISQYGCNSRFIMYMIQSDGIQEQIRLLSKQTAQANLFLGAIASLMIPLPSIEEQNELVERLDTLLFKMQQSKEIAEQAIDQINTLKKVILARAFRGELGTNDPKDESAVELLKSIL